MEYNPSQISDVDSVEIVNLIGIEVNRADLYMREAVSAPFVRLSGEAVQEIARLWRELPSSGQRRCHIPPFGLRFCNKDLLILQASICWQCNNIFGELNSNEIFYEFDADHPISQELLSICQQFFE